MDAGQSAGTLSDLERLAYLVVRMPATAAALSSALDELRNRPERPLESLLDLGCGPGTSLWAATDALPALAEATLIDADPGMLALGERLWQRHPRRESLRVRWGRTSLVGERPWPAHDVVLLSYVMGELRPDAAAAVLSHAQHAARAVLVLVEPGTPRGFSRVLAARDALIGTGWRVVAPCPHDRDCPLRAASKGGRDWCHFAARLARSRMHRHLKGGDLGWEDEKFSYVIVERAAGKLSRANARVIRHPVKDTGHVKLALCTAEGLVEQVVTRRDREAYRRARDARWGKEWEAESRK